ATGWQQGGPQGAQFDQAPLIFPGALAPGACLHPYVPAIAPAQMPQQLHPALSPAPPLPMHTSPSLHHPQPPQLLYQQQQPQQQQQQPQQQLPPQVPLQQPHLFHPQQLLQPMQQQAQQQPLHQQAPQPPSPQPSMQQPPQQPQPPPQQQQHHMQQQEQQQQHHPQQQLQQQLHPAHPHHQQQQQQMQLQHHFQPGHQLLPMPQPAAGPSREEERQRQRQAAEEVLARQRAWAESMQRQHAAPAPSLLDPPPPPAMPPKATPQPARAEATEPPQKAPTSNSGAVTSSTGDKFLTTEDLLKAIGIQSPASASSWSKSPAASSTAKSPAAEPSKPRLRAAEAVAWTPQIGAARQVRPPPGSSKGARDAIGEGRWSGYGGKEEGAWTEPKTAQKWQEKDEKSAGKAGKGWAPKEQPAVAVREERNGGAAESSERRHSARPIGAPAEAAAPESFTGEDGEAEGADPGAPAGFRKPRRRGKVSEYNTSEQEQWTETTWSSAASAPRTRRRGKFPEHSEEAQQPQWRPR
ncbi:unnamed protein product, partial [Polarella glacialis]